MSPKAKKKGKEEIVRLSDHDVVCCDETSSSPCRFCETSVTLVFLEVRVVECVRAVSHHDVFRVGSRASASSEPNFEPAATSAAADNVTAATDQLAATADDKPSAANDRSCAHDGTCQRLPKSCGSHKIDQSVELHEQWSQD